MVWGGGQSPAIPPGAPPGGPGIVKGEKEYEDLLPTATETDKG